MKTTLLSACLLGCAVSAQAQSCQGGLYLNPQVIRGEGASQTESALRELIEFIKPSGLSVAPVLNIKETQDVLTAVKKPSPPCWVYGNPVVGTKSGVTTTLVQAEKLCGTVIEVTPQQGLGQSYLPTKAAFHWQADRWVGLITRLQTAQGSTMKSHHGTDERIHMAQLFIVPATNPSWGYGLYVRPDAPADAARKAGALLTGLKTENPLLLKALDLGKTYEFATPGDAAVAAMQKSLTP